MIDLATRAVACKGWKWMLGMSTLEDERVTWVGEDRVGDCDSLIPSSSLPDLDDPATIGCLLALVREAVSDPHAHVDFYQGEWCVQWQLSPDEDSPFCLVADSEAAALVTALEYAHA